MWKNLPTFLLLSIVPMLASAAPRKGPCGEKATPARLTSAHATTWDDLFLYYRTYGKCSDEVAAEISSNSIAKLLATNWESTPHLVELVAKDKGFRRFVRLNLSMSWPDLRTIRRNATERCPSELDELCGEFKRQAEQLNQIKMAQFDREVGPPEHMWRADTIKLRARVIAVHQLGELSGTALPVDIDPHFAVTVHIDSATPQVPELQPGSEVTFGIHSPALAFGGDPKIGRKYNFDICRAIVKGELQFSRFGVGLKGKSLGGCASPDGARNNQW